MKVGDKVKVVTDQSSYFGQVGTVTEIDKSIRVSFSGNSYTTFWKPEELEKLIEYYVKASSNTLLRLYKTGNAGWQAERYKDGVTRLGIGVDTPMEEDFVKGLQMLFDAKFTEVVYHTTIETKEPVSLVMTHGIDSSGPTSNIFITKNKEVTK